MFNSYKQQHQFFRIPVLVLICFLYLVVCPLRGQALQKRHLSFSDYALWGHMESGKISPDEKWTCFNMTYQNGADTLFVKSTVTNAVFSFPSGRQALFTKNNHFVYYAGQALHIVDLKNHKSERFNVLPNYTYSEAADKLIMQQAEENKLLIYTPMGKTREIAQVQKFSLSPDTGILIYSTFSFGTNYANLLDLHKDGSSKIIAEGTDYFENFSWNQNSKAVAFYSKSATETVNSLLFYSLKSGDLFELNPKLENSIPKEMEISDKSGNALLVSENSQMVFFKMAVRTAAETVKESNAEIWNTNDKWVFPEEQNYGKFHEQPKLMVWRPSTGSVLPISSDILPHVMLTGDNSHAILSNPQEYEPQFEAEGPRDFYIMDVKTGFKELMLKKQSAVFYDVVCSPQGRYIAYFNAGNWWIYDSKMKSHTNITLRTGTAFEGKFRVFEPLTTFGNPAWNKDDKEILLYDEFDIWAITPDGKKSRRLTRGRELKIRFRIAKIPNTNGLEFKYNGLVIPNIDLEKGLLLKAEGDDGKTGYYSWNKKDGLQPIIYRNSYISDINYSANKKVYFVTEQKFDLPPRLISTKKSSNEKIIYQSNEHHKMFYWGRSELVNFKNSKQRSLKGVLYYPANYYPEKKYPMIVSIYEKQSEELHKYQNPTAYNDAGVNPSVLASLGYFVFLPDIIHESENVGPSTLDCVTAGTQKIIDMGIIDSKRIALLGHSFGGYETLFVVNQTKMFAAAVASGAITDLRSHYLTMGWNNSKPDMWRYGTEEWRLSGKTPFENPADFDRNSPLEWITNLETPLLMWSGKEDTQVDWRQSIEYYLALRRLGKKSVLLLYPGENHVPSKQVNQKDITEKVIQWMDYYLKDKKNYPWIKKAME